ncbi:MAG: tRNA preQ1(34) S-adenosylmethionine ribosyltransferase-isomerase QueA [Desulfatiglandales bacterium]
MYSLKDYAYELPKELVAQEPALERDQSRLMLVDRRERSICHHHFFELPKLLRAGDLLVVNDTEVVRARLMGRRPTGGKVEVLILDTRGDLEKRRCLIRARKRLPLGERIIFDEENSATVEAFLGDGTALLSFSLKGSLVDFLESKGELPLPPYISPPQRDRVSFYWERYQTVYSRSKGAVAAPTAGLHFSQRVLEELGSSGIGMTSVTLHVSYGTFKPVRTEDIREHKVDPEPFYVSEEAAEEINEALSQKRRVICVGTTSLRAVESAASPEGVVIPTSGVTDLCIFPGYRFKIPSGLITNFHLPKTSLLFLVAAFMGLDLLKEAYNIAIQERYRFFSYGDAMLIL